MWRGEIPVDECWGLLMRLPRDSPLIGALLADPDFVSGDAKPSPPPWTEFGPDIAVLAGIHDLLASLASSVAALGGGKLKIEPYPRPRDLAREHRMAQRWAAHKARVALLIPPKEA